MPKVWRAPRSDLGGGARYMTGVDRREVLDDSRYMTGACVRARRCPRRSKL